MSRVEPPGARVPVFMYHAVRSVPDGPLRQFAVPPRRLAEQLRALAGAGFRLVGLAEAMTRRSPAPGEPDRIAALTFDDGYADFLDSALPVLREVGASATLYPAVGFIGREPSWLGTGAQLFGPVLSWSALAEVAAAGIEIGNHGLGHYPLDVLPVAQAREDVRVSRESLEQRLGRAVRGFCYPYGYHNQAVRAAVAWAGHDHACAVGYRRYQASDDRMAVPRLHPTPDHTGEDLVAMATRDGSPLVGWARSAVQPAWRLTRRAAARVGYTLT